MNIPPSKRPIPNSDNADLELVEPMPHSDAVRLNAAELYVLKELNPQQELRFEAHYFECPECAGTVAVLQSLLEQHHRPVDTAATQPWWRRWFSIPILVPAAAALLALATFQNVFTIPSLRLQLAELTAPQANTEVLAKPFEMGEDDGKPITTPSITVTLVLPVEATSPFYKIEILGARGGPISKVVPAPQGSRLSLQMAKQTLGHGTFNIFVYGLAKQADPSGPQVGQFHLNVPKGNE